MLARKGYTVLWGGGSDIFPAVEEVTKTSLNMMRLLRAHNISWNASTKSITPSTPVYLNEIKSAGDRVQMRVSFSTVDDAKARILEPGAPPPSARILSLKKMSDSGVHTIARLSPFIPGVSAPSTAVEDLARVLEKFKGAAPYVTIKFLSVNLCLKNQVWIPMFEQLGLNGLDWINSYCVSKSRNSSLKMASVEWYATAIINLKKAAQQVGIKIGFEFGMFSLAMALTDGKFCCDAGADLRPNPNSMPVMFKEGRIPKMELVNPAPFPKKLTESLVLFVAECRKNAEEMDKAKRGDSRARVDRKG